MPDELSPQNVEFVLLPVWERPCRKKIGTVKLFEKTLEGSQMKLLHHCCLLVLVKAQMM